LTHASQQKGKRGASAFKHRVFDVNFRKDEDFFLKRKE
jgi:hypothetical protein